MREDKELDKIWFTADLHFLHKKIVDICNRPTTAECHDEWLIDRFNSVVAKNDTLYILGDVSMGNKSNTEKLLAKLHGNKFLILGNHDNSIANSTMFEQITQIKNFTFTSPSASNIHIVLCHYPILSWERRIHGAMHLYGHVHGRLQNSGLSFDIGVDANNWYPLSLRMVLDKFGQMEFDKGIDAIGE